MCGALIYTHIIMQVDILLRDYMVKLQIVLPAEFITTTIEANKRFYFICMYTLRLGVGYVLYTNMQHIRAGKNTKSLVYFDVLIATY